MGIYVSATLLNFDRTPYTGLAEINNEWVEINEGRLNVLERPNEEFSISVPQYEFLKEVELRTSDINLGEIVVQRQGKVTVTSMLVDYNRDPFTGLIKIDSDWVQIVDGKLETVKNPNEVMTIFVPVFEFTKEFQLSFLDEDLGDIQVELENTVTVTGKLLDCDNSLFTGFVDVNSIEVPVVNGNFSYDSEENITLILSVPDNNFSKEIVLGTSDQDLGNLIVCTEKEDSTYDFTNWVSDANWTFQCQWFHVFNADDNSEVENLKSILASGNVKIRNSNEIFEFRGGEYDGVSPFIRISLPGGIPTGNKKIPITDASAATVEIESSECSFKNARNLDLILDLTSYKVEAEGTGLILLQGTYEELVDGEWIDRTMRLDYYLVMD
jgi:hypothetical protein